MGGDYRHEVVLMRQLGWPSLLCHRLQIDAEVLAGNLPRAESLLKQLPSRAGQAEVLRIGGDLAMASLAAEAVDYLFDVPEFASLDRALATELMEKMTAEDIAAALVRAHRASTPSRAATTAGCSAPSCRWWCSASSW